MNKWHTETSADSRRQAVGKLYRGPVLWIVVLLAGWLVVSEWPAVASSVLSFAH